MAAINSQLESGNFNARERSIILERVRANSQNAERQPVEKTPELQR